MTGDVRRAALLIRWQDHGIETRWKATVENAYTGEQLHFINKRELMRFLWEWVYGDVPAPSDAHGDEDSAANDGIGRDTS